MVGAIYRHSCPGQGDHQDRLGFVKLPSKRLAPDVTSCLTLLLRKEATPESWVIDCIRPASLRAKRRFRSAHYATMTVSGCFRRHATARQATVSIARPILARPSKSIGKNNKVGTGSIPVPIPLIRCANFGSRRLLQRLVRRGW